MIVASVSAAPWAGRYSGMLEMRLVHQPSPNICSTAATICSAFGRQYDSSSGAKGTGTSGAATSCGGHFSAAGRRGTTSEITRSPSPCVGAAFLHHQQPARLLAPTRGSAPGPAAAARTGSRLRSSAALRAAAASASWTIAPKATTVSVGALACSAAAARPLPVAVEIDLAALAPVEQLVLEHQARVAVVEAGHQGLERLLGVAG